MDSSRTARKRKDESLGVWGGVRQRLSCNDETTDTRRCDDNGSPRLLVLQLDLCPRQCCDHFDRAQPHLVRQRPTSCSSRASERRTAGSPTACREPTLVDSAELALRDRLWHLALLSRCKCKPYTYRKAVGGTDGPHLRSTGATTATTAIARKTRDDNKSDGEHRNVDD